MGARGFAGAERRETQPPDERTPCTRSVERQDLETAFCELWATGHSTSIVGVKRWLAERARDPDAAVAVGNGHGDVPHGDG